GALASEPANACAVLIGPELHLEACAQLPCDLPRQPGTVLGEPGSQFRGPPFQIVEGIVVALFPAPEIPNQPLAEAALRVVDRPVKPQHRVCIIREHPYNGNLVRGPVHAGNLPLNQHAKTAARPRLALSRRCVVGHDGEMEPASSDAPAAAFNGAEA